MNELDAANAMVTIFGILNKLTPIGRASVISNVAKHYGMAVVDQTDSILDRIEKMTRGSLDPDDESAYRAALDKVSK